MQVWGKRAIFCVLWLFFYAGTLCIECQWAVSLSVIASLLFVLLWLFQQMESETRGRESRLLTACFV